MLVPPDVRFTQLPLEALKALDSVATEAKNLLGARLTVDRDGAEVTLRISEVEAYGGGYDPASHAYRGLSQRNRSMFGPPGHTYVYRHLGLHTCMNIVVGDEGVPTGILLRAGEIIDGEEPARARRLGRGVTRSAVDLAAGPARLTVALGITHADDGHPLDGSTGILLEPRTGPRPTIVSGPRIGISKAADFPLRFSIADDPTVSR
ncbi:MAG TPA: DNA-3-methyladenine glycosylase [Tessaracoccus flavescens]|uniref:Putative 3-methyladenine DNA glycosylase n=1 Tax=Tessaracoccus flavescens TaxID=399497 RepID=A0A921ENE5_9ACTN|nr:DNA-3-methyladenine glycosylase [Tessaracoccus flavescens]